MLSSIPVEISTSIQLLSPLKKLQSFHQNHSAKVSDEDDLSIFALCKKKKLFTGVKFGLAH
jgi:hypothetical protein